MSLNDTGLALGTVSRFLAARLNTALSTLPPYYTVATIDRPQASSSATGATVAARLNLFLYEVEIDAAMRNVPIVPGLPAPLWLVLRYLMTAFDLTGESDTADSHDVLGLGLQVMSGLNETLFGDPVNGSSALENNPEPIKLSFDQATPDLLSRLMQGPDDKYRCSTAFQIRPILVARPIAPTSGLQLVGIDYTTGTTIGLAGVQSAVLPSLGPRIDDAAPSLVEVGDTLTLTGLGLDAPGLAVAFGPASLAVTLQRPTQLQARVQPLDPTQVSAGNIAVSVTQTLSTGVQISSAVRSVGLIPTVSGMALGVLAAVASTNDAVFGTISLTGVLLGTDHDYVEFALVQGGVAAILLDAHDPTFTLPADQSAQRFAIPKEQAVPPGVYFAVLRVNGMQARQAFVLDMVAP